MITSYPKHRGRGEWKSLVSQEDMARAFQKMLPREPSGDYRIISLSYFQDPGLENIPAGWSAAPASIQRDLSRTYRAGIKALACETDYNFGRYGLAYWLYAKMLWNPSMTVEELDALRDRWLQPQGNEVARCGSVGWLHPQDGHALSWLARPEGHSQGAASRHRRSQDPPRPAGTR